MAQTTPPDISPVPTPAIQRGDRATFAGRVDAFILWLVTAVGQFRALAANVYGNAVDAYNSAITAVTAAGVASAQANAAQALVGVQGWSSGTAYAKDAAAISPTNSQTYRRTAANPGAASTVDPASDQVNWRLLAGNDSNGAFVPIPVTGNDIDLRTGNYFTRTNNANAALTISNCPSDGFMFTLKHTLVSGALTLPANVYLAADTATVMNTGKVHRLMFITEDHGAHWALSIAPNYSF